MYLKKTLLSRSTKKDSKKQTDKGGQERMIIEKLSRTKSRKPQYMIFVKKIRDRSFSGHKITQKKRIMRYLLISVKSV